MEAGQVRDGPDGPYLRPVSVATVRASFNRAVKNHFSVTWFGRPIADWITPLFYNTGWSANGVTLFRIGIAFVALAVLLGASPWLPPLAMILFYACFVLDCVDGNVARLAGTVTYWGKFIDGLADFVFILGAPMAAGTGIWLSGGDAVWMLAGAMTAACSLTSQMVRARLSFMREWMAGRSGPVAPELELRVAGARRLQRWAQVVYVNGTFFAPLFLAVPGDGRWLFVLALLPVQLATELVWLSGTLREARIILERPRRSIHAAPAGNDAATG